MREFPAPDDLRSILDTIISDRNPQAASVTSAALLDGVLERAILSKLTIHDDEHRRAMFGVGAPLRDFMPKVNLGCALKLYGPLSRKDMKTIAEIRNAFAHTTVRLTFRTAEIIAATQRIGLVDRFLGVTADQNGLTPRNRFMQAVRLFSIALSNPHRLRSLDPALKNFTLAIAA